jgi:tetratricopeptide (TPR) repeat protein
MAELRCVDHAGSRSDIQSRTAYARHRRCHGRVIAKFRETLAAIRSEVRWTVRSIRAGQHYGRALKLEKRGRYEEAFAVRGRALELLPDEIEPGTLPVATVLSSAVVMTVSYSQIAERLGRPQAAHDAIKRTIRLATPFEFDSTTRDYLDWLRSQLQAPTTSPDAPDRAGSPPSPLRCDS